MVSHILLCVALLSVFNFLTVANQTKNDAASARFFGIPPQEMPMMPNMYPPGYQIPPMHHASHMPEMPIVPYGAPPGNILPMALPPIPRFPPMAFPPMPMPGPLPQPRAYNQEGETMPMLPETPPDMPVAQHSPSSVPGPMPPPMPVPSHHHMMQHPFPHFSPMPFPMPFPHFPTHHFPHFPFFPPRHPPPVDHFYCSSHASFALTIALDAIKLPPPLLSVMPMVSAGRQKRSDPDVGIGIPRPPRHPIVETRQFCRFVATTSANACTACCQVAARHYPLSQAEVMGLMLFFDPRKTPVPPHVGASMRGKRNAGINFGASSMSSSSSEAKRFNCLCCAPKNLFSVF